MSHLGKPFPDGCGRILLYRGTGVVSYLIRWFTRSEYSHAALLYPDGDTVIESMQGYGVRKRSIYDLDEPYDVFRVANMTPQQWNYAIAFCAGEIGCGYDYRSVIRFLTRQHAGSPNRWFCSELVFAAIRHAGPWLLERIEDWAVDPGDLRLSSLLIDGP